MKEELSLPVARRIQKLLIEKKISGSFLPYSLGQELLEEELLIFVPRGTHKIYRLGDEQGLRTYLSQHYEIDNLERWIEVKSCEKEMTRSEQVQAVGNSKLGLSRSFKGFLVRSVVTIKATLRDEPFVIQPINGVSIFVEDYEYFRIPENVVIIGMENGENFQSVEAQQYLFEGMEVLFVSRYPQSKDLRSWLQKIPNRYIHFGDFDLAGISIYLTEFYAYLGEKAEFFIPADINERLEKGNRALYDKQYEKYWKMKISDERIRPLIELIHKYKRGYEQEGYIVCSPKTKK